jgi:hypothetical protein
MDATERGRRAEGLLIAEAVDVNVARVRVHIATAIEAFLQSFEPQDARGDGFQRQTVAQVADDFPAFEDSSRLAARADLFRDAMQAERGPVRTSNLADAELGGGDGYCLARASLQESKGCSKSGRFGWRRWRQR